MDVTGGAGVDVLLRQSFDQTSFAVTRRMVRDQTAAAGADEERATSFAYAVHEGLINAVMHGGGGGDLTLLREDDRRLIAVVEDRAPSEPFPIPTAPPSQLSPGGRGLWLASQLCDGLRVERGVRGTRLVLELMIHPA